MVDFDPDYQVNETVRSRCMKQACAVYGCNGNPTSGCYRYINGNFNLEIYVLLCDRHRSMDTAHHGPMERITILENEVEKINKVLRISLA